MRQEVRCEFATAGSKAARYAWLCSRDEQRGQRLATSETATDCNARVWARYAHRRGRIDAEHRVEHHDEHNRGSGLRCQHYLGRQH